VRKKDRTHQLLQTLYEISLLLANFRTLEETLPEILARTSHVVPFLSAVLIEKKGLIPEAKIWHRPDTSKKNILSALNQAKESFVYLTGASPVELALISMKNTVTTPLRVTLSAQRSVRRVHTNFISCPLVVSGHPAFGSFQWEGSVQMNEKHVAFINTLANLIAVALDRQYIGELRESVIAGLSHDLRTPLTAAKLNAEMILRQIEKPGTVELLASRIVDNVSRVDKMIRDFLDSNKDRAEALPSMRIEGCDFRAIVIETLHDLVTLHGDRFVLQAPDPELRSFCSHDNIRRALENLVNNAVKYGSPDLPITVSLKQSESEIQIAVHNEGSFLSPLDQKKLFQQYYRTHAAAADKTTGWGLGLAFVNRVVLSHGGRIQVSSGPEIGTTFTITLPKDARQFHSKVA
jgi:signal transduction histidine kinase